MKLQRVLLKIWFPILILTLWQLMLRNSTNPFFPSPSKILKSAQSILSRDWFFSSVMPSLQTFILGYVIGCTLGVLLGALIGSNTRTIQIWNPITNFIRSVPSVAKIPVIMALLGIGMSSRVCSVAVAVLFPVLMSTMRAIASTDEQQIEVSRILGLSRSQAMTTVRIPAATGEILTGLHAAVQVALLIMVVSEMLGANAGLGAFIIHSQSTFMISDMWVGALFLGLIGLVLNEIFLHVERRIAPWYFKSKELR